MKRFAACFAIAVSLLCAAPVRVYPQAAPVAPGTRPSDAAAQLDALVDNRDYPAVAKQLATAQLEGPTGDYFAGVLANRENRLQESVPLLEKAVPEAKRTSRKRAAVALRSLADSYTKLFRYADAERAFAEVVAHYSDAFDKAERQTLSDDYGTSKLLVDAAPQTVAFERAFSIDTHRGPLGTIDTDLALNGITTSWIVDTGANFSVVSSSMARKMHLKVSDKTATTQGITGAENELRIAVVPEFHIGEAVVHNMIVLVLEDKSLNVPLSATKNHQIEAILGYPVLSAFKTVTFSDGKLELGKTSPAAGGAPLYMEQLMPLLLCRVQDRDLIFQFDTGANHSMFTTKYLNQFRSDFQKAKERPYGIGGAGGVRREMVYYQPEVRLGVGDRTAIIKDAPVLTKPLGTDLDKLNGNLGRDVVEEFQSFTIDFEHMRLRLGEPKKQPAPERSAAAKAGESA